MSSSNKHAVSLLKQCVKTFFFKDSLALYPDEIPNTLDYVNRVQRTDPLNERFVESSATKHVVNLAHDRSGYLKIKNLEIPNENGDFSINDFKRVSQRKPITARRQAPKGDSHRTDTAWIPSR
jgi:hypothetical protein